MPKLEYFLTQTTAPRSFDPADSDLISNLVHMEQIVGTLLKYNSVNQYEPYIAKEWSHSPDRLVWTYLLRTDLQCEDGSQIDAPNFVDGLHLAIRNHAFFKNVPVFSQLVGWNRFFEGKSSFIEGIRVGASNQVSFHFNSPPNGLNFYLSMPYYGFFCKGDFNEAGKWKDKGKITSSGAYRLETFDQAKNVVRLKLRENWPLLENRSSIPNEVDIPVIDGSALYQSPKSRSIVLASLDESTKFNGKWQLLEGAQTFSTSVVLNSEREIFKDKAIRENLAILISDKIEQSKLSLKTVLISTQFYPSSYHPPREQANLEKLRSLRGKTLTIETLLQKNLRTEFIQKLLSNVANEVGFSLNYVGIEDSETSQARYFERRDHELDLFFIHVDKGGAADPDVIDMMFCSKMGARFPDPSGTICRLTKGMQGRDYSIEELNEYSREFENALVKDRSVIPMAHRGQFWLISDDIDPSGLSPTMGIPRFDRVKFR